MWSAGIFLSNTLPSFRNPGAVDGVPKSAQPPAEVVLWIDSAWQDRVLQRGPTYLNRAAPADGLASAQQPDARRYDTPSMGSE